MDGDEPGVANKTIEAIESWPPGLPVFGLLTPYPATPLYDRLLQQGRLTRPKHWLDFKPFEMAFAPESITIEQAEAEVGEAWASCYSPEAIASALKRIEGRPFVERAVMLVTRLTFRGIYFPQMTKRHLLKLVWQNRSNLTKILGEGWAANRRHRRNKATQMAESVPEVSKPVEKQMSR